MRRPSVRVALLALATLAMVAAACGDGGAPSPRPVRILTGEPAVLDPARQGDAGSAAVTAQFFETLVTFDQQLVLQPALAESWRVEPGGTRIVFQLRPDLVFSDGSPLRASDVTRSWLRLIDPDRPSPLASLMLVVAGAVDYIGGSGDVASVGLTADDAARTLTVDLARPSSDFIDVVTSPNFGVVSREDGVGAFVPGPGFVGSGGYTPTGQGTTSITLTANPHYWAGPPAITTIELVTDTGGQSPVEMFEDGSLDYTPVFDQDAAWIAYDANLGPQLRQVQSLITSYYGFDAGQPPFDDVRVRQAFAMAVDWRRIGQLASTGGDPETDVATSMVPPGIPGRSDEDFVPVHDPVAARALLAEAGFPGGQGFPTVTMVTNGGAHDAAVLAEVRRELGITLGYETMDFGLYIDRLDNDPPAIWSSNWVADYPGRNDYLGVLLGRDSTNDYGRWDSAEFDAAIEEAAAASDPAIASAAYDRAESIVRRDAPVVPIAYGGDGWALSRDGLLGAGQNGMGIIRMAGLAWAE